MTFIISFDKTAEEDIFKSGCEIGNSIYCTDIKFEAETIKELLTKIKDYFYVDAENILINSCDENGRVDIQVYENAEGYQATGDALKEWKNAKIKLWLCTYTGYIKKLTDVKILKKDYKGLGIEY